MIVIEVTRNVSPALRGLKTATRHRTGGIQARQLAPNYVTAWSSLSRLRHFLYIVFCACAAGQTPRAALCNSLRPSEPRHTSDPRDLTFTHSPLTLHVPHPPILSPFLSAPPPSNTPFKLLFPHPTRPPWQAYPRFPIFKKVK